ncbi:polyunsaturated fatty acid 5-lipoxygenase-like [Heptranchias perlo]|uniref:polyunsaturated fatty acid 5-lipoxygenase-like n=1 Tax=Heptranchias perlo TaxID=212740 RepID=UPI00355A1914
MVTYKVTFRTGTAEYSGTGSYVHCMLIGERGPSQKTIVDKRLQNDLERGAVDQYDVTSDKDLGTIWFVELEVTRFLVPDYWFCNSVTVETPSGQTFHFPCYRWLDDCTIRLREGTAKRVCDDKLPIFQSHRQEELQERQKLYRWKVWGPNAPRCIDAETEDDLPMDMRFSCEKQRDFEGSLELALGALFLKWFMNLFHQSWSNLEDFDRIFLRIKNPVAAFAREHWKEDWLFGYQFMNGLNPVLIQKCGKIPVNFPVTNAMVRKFLGNSTLAREIKNGNIFIVNYKILDGIGANVIHGVQQYLAAPICLLYLDKQNRMMPIAIQLKQTPGGDNPIFHPSDPELDWLLAKTWVRSADFQFFQLISHLLRTHLIAEPFCIATIRQLPSVHPIYKLLMPHTRYTLEINTRGRKELISENGVMNKAFGVGVEGHILLNQREFLAITYQSLCLPESLELRGVEELKGYYYKDDGLQIWSAIHKFVNKIVRFYYENDQQVKDDPELLAWIKDLTGIGFQDLKNSGIPTSFSNRNELCKFLTMVIFTCSAQHAAVNNGQYDWGAWVPNSPCSMRKPPPTTKGTVTMEHIMESLPDITQSCIEMAITWHLSRPQAEMRKLGDYKEEYFTEEAVKNIIGEFQDELKAIDRTIQERNEDLALKYEYLRPINIDNSISI